jgi:effector-binding domain-containing protein
MTTTQEATMKLTTTPDTVLRPAAHYIFVEKIGPFQINAPEAWKELHTHLPEIAQHETITGYFSLYCADRQIYRAGVSLAAKPSSVPALLAYEEIQGGKYARFTLTGPYPQLAEATGRVFKIIEEIQLPLRADYNIENYVNDPRTTPEDELITEILFPLA